MGLKSEHYKIAKANGISRNLAYERHETLFYSVEDAITKPVRKITDEFLYWREKALENNISYVTFWKRRKKGMTLEEAATTPKRNPGKRKSS